MNRENSKANVEAMQSKPQSQVKRMERMDRKESESDVDERIDYLQRELEDVMRIRKASGKYSGRAAKESGKGKCKSCTYEHDSSRRCPAEGRKCHK